MLVLKHQHSQQIKSGYYQRPMGSANQVLSTNGSGTLSWAAGVSGNTYASDLKLGRDSNNHIDFTTKTNSFQFKRTAYLLTEHNNSDQIITFYLGSTYDSEIAPNITDDGTAGKKLRIYAGDVEPDNGHNNINGGDLELYSGKATGTGYAAITFNVSLESNGSSGDGENQQVEVMKISGQ